MKDPADKKGRTEKDHRHQQQANADRPHSVRFPSSDSKDQAVDDQ